MRNLEKLLTIFCFTFSLYLVICIVVVSILNPTTIEGVWGWIALSTLSSLGITGILHFIFYKFSKENEFKNSFDLTFNILIFISGSFAILNFWKLGLPDSRLNVYINNPAMPTVLFILVANYTLYKSIINLLYRNNRIKNNW